MNNKCNLIRDILPLYVEDMVSMDTREFVSEHLEHCETCRAELEHMRKPADIIPDADIVPLKKIKKELFIKRLQTVFLTAILAMCHSDGSLWNFNITYIFPLFR